MAVAFSSYSHATSISKPAVSHSGDQFSEDAYTVVHVSIDDMTYGRRRGWTTVVDCRKKAVLYKSH